MEKSDVIADVLQFPQVVRGNDGSQPALCHRVGKDTLNQLAHDRIEPVKGFIAEQIPRHGGKPEQNCRLLLHALGIGCDLPAARQRKQVGQPLIFFCGEARIRRGVEPCHVIQRGGGQEILLVGQIDDLIFQRHIFKDGLAVVFHTAAVRAEYAAHHAEQRGLARPVGADQSENRAALDHRVDAVERLYAVIAFCHLVNPDHVRHPHSSAWILPLFLPRRHAARRIPPPRGCCPPLPKAALPCACRQAAKYRAK